VGRLFPMARLPLAIPTLRSAQHLGTARA
jgi:hypothetical protein